MFVYFWYSSLNNPVMKNQFAWVFFLLILFLCQDAPAQVRIDASGGTPDQSSMLDVVSTNRGFLMPRMSSSNRLSIALPADGLMVYDNALKSFWFHNGTAWTELLWDKLWSRNAGLSATFLQNNNDKVGIGTAAPGYLLHLYDQISINDRPPLFIEQTGPGDPSAGFFSNAFQCYTIGFDITHNSFKITDTSVLIGNNYSGKHNMLTISNMNRGIVHMNHQSRARAFLTGLMIPPVGQGQIIPFGIWTTIGFDSKSYDEQNEFTPSPPFPPFPPAAGAFTAKEEGYYQINARTEFSTDPPDNTTNSYVRIAIYVNGIPRSFGNSLNWYDSNTDRTFGNDGPVVSDILHLFPGDVITVRVWQNINGASAIVVGGEAVTFVSIHKLS
jgi:hypothetical protein